MGRNGLRARHFTSEVAGQARPGSMRSLLALYAENMQVRGQSLMTVKSRGYYALMFIEWCEERGLHHPTDVSYDTFAQYQRWMFHYRTSDDKPLGLSSQSTRLVAIRCFFRWLLRSRYILANPATELELPKTGHKLPKYVLSAVEVENILRAVDLDAPLGLRDRVILEMLYSTGMRRTELSSLKLGDVELGRGVLNIRGGKGCRDRTIPIGARAQLWLEKYLCELRPILAARKQQDGLFLTEHGRNFQASYLGWVVKEYLDKVGLGHVGCCHVFRHTMATLMLDNGADIRYVQAMLGHKSLETTQVYTHVAIRKLQEIHAATHPARVTRSVAPVNDDSVD